MAEGSQTPRQKMIGVMYLVLTALLALNVSKETLNAFLVVNDNVEQSNSNFSQKIRNLYNTFEQDYKVNKLEVEPFWIKARKAQSLTHEIIEYIKSIKTGVVAYSEKIPLDSAEILDLPDIKTKDNYTDPTNYFIGNSEDGSAGKARELKLKLNEYKQEMINLVDPKYRHRLRLGLITDGNYYNADNELQNWEMHNFYYSILVADIVILNNIITEVYNAEFDIVKTLYEEIRAEDFHYDNITARVLAESNYIFVGDSYRAEIVVAASDSTQNPEVFYEIGIDSLKPERIDNALKLDCSQGKVFIELVEKTPGIKKFAGIVRVTNINGESNDYHFSDEYIVAEPSLTVSATKMNVLYIGVENIVSISVPGIPKENLLPTISCGSLIKDEYSDGWFADIPPGYRQAEINVSALINGVYKDMGSKHFRVKKLPNPTALVAGKNEGFVDKEILIASGGIISRMPDDFEYDLSFEVVSFMMTIQRGFSVYHYKSDSSEFTEEMIQQMSILNRGQNVLFENIIVKDPNGEERQIPPVVLSIN